MITSRKQLRPLLELSDHMTDTSNRAKIGYGLVTLSHFWVICTRNGNFSMGSTRFFFLTLTFHMNKTLCCSRKYPYPSHRRFFKLNSPPPPLQKFHSSVILSFRKIGLLKSPSPSEFLLTFLGVGMDIFWNYTFKTCCQSQHYHIQMRPNFNPIWSKLLFATTSSKLPPGLDILDGHLLAVRLYLLNLFVILFVLFCKLRVLSEHRNSKVIYSENVN